MNNFIERPILFSGEMVRAILEGKKTQTRRVVPEKIINKHRVYEEWCVSNLPNVQNNRGYEEQFFFCHCPYVRRDRLWVRETHAIINREGLHTTVYKADQNEANQNRWTPSIHMPRWASRISLEITGVRVERLQDISRGDCMSEGCPFPNRAKETDPVRWFSELWSSVYGEENWFDNPWVWVIEFKIIDKKAGSDN